MGRKIVFLHIFIGFLTLSIGTPSDVESSTSTSVSVSTVTRKVTSKSVSRSYRTEVSTKEALPVTEEIPVAIQDADKPSPPTRDDGEDVTKPLKPKKKILASNLKNVSEKVVLLSDRHERENLLKSVINVTEESESKDGGKNSSDSFEDELPEESSPKSLNETVVVEVSRNSTSSVRKEGAVVEGRSLEDRSSEENINVSRNGKTKSSGTERTASGYVTFGGLQKVINNDLNGEGFSQRGTYKITRPSPSVTLPTKKSTPISKDSSLKNTIRFESEYYGPTGQTDWVPIIPDKLPVRPSSTSQQFGSRVRGGAGERSNKTDRNAIVFPTDNDQGHKETNVILVKEEVEKTTVRLKNSAEKPTRPPNSTESGRPSSTQQPIKFRGAVRYKPSQANSTVDDKKSQNETVFKRSNSTSGMEIPVTGASWTLATLGGSTRSTEKPEEITEISVVTVLSSTNHTVKSQNAVNNGIVVPPENVRVNVTKEQQGIMNSILENGVQSAIKQNESAIANDLPKILEGWGPAKAVQTVNQTNVVVPGLVDVIRSNDSVQLTKTTETSVNVTTKDTATTKSVPEVTTRTTTGNTVFEVSSQSSVSNSSMEKISEYPVTLVYDKPATTEADVTETPATEMFSTTLPPENFNVGVETSNKTVGNVSTNVSEESSPETESVANATTESTQTMVDTTTVAGGANTTLATLMSKEMSVTTGGLNSSATTFSEISPTTAATLHPVTATTTTKPTETTKVISSTESTTARIIHIPLATNMTTTPSTTTTTITTPSTTTSTTTTTITPSTTTTANNTTSATTVPSTTTPSTTTTTINITTTTTTSTTTPSTTTTTVKESTEEGIYYKNYIPTTINPHDDITEENVPAYLRLTVQAASWEELCRLKEDLRDSIIKMLGGKNVSAEAVHFLNLNDRNCLEKIEETKRDPNNGTIFLPVNMFLMDKNGDFDKNLSEAFLTLWGRRGLDFELPIRKVDFVTPIVNLTELADSPLGGSVVAAIVISCVAGICVILLGILFVIMKRRQKRFNYGQRCTPVSLDAYSLDSVSIYNSVRRKGMRASKRSYGNAAFDDPEVPTHPMNFAGLANFSSDKEQLYEEFNIIPQVYPKVEELPAGAETKNRYANIIPLPETRVHLTVKDGDPLSDYINANYVRGLKGAEKLYIACQAPMESTIEDFWRMVWEQQCKVILMLTDLQENGIEKCADYLPPNEVTDNLRLFGDFQVTLKKRDVKEKYIISNLKLKNMEANLWREVTHLWYLGWPDQGVPAEANSLIAFLIEARSQMKIQNGVATSSPAVVHCSPGTGRTGTVIACDLCIRDYEQNRMVDIPKCVFNLRRDRAGSVQTKDQYAFIYQVLNVYATKLSGGGIESI